MASTCRLFAFCFLVFFAVSAPAATQPARSASGIIVASAQVSRPIGLTEISTQKDLANFSPEISLVTPSLWYVHAIRTESVLIELSSSSNHMLLESSHMISLNRELTTMAGEASCLSANNYVVISITTIAD